MKVYDEYMTRIYVRQGSKNESVCVERSSCTSVFDRLKWSRKKIWNKKIKNMDFNVKYWVCEIRTVSYGHLIMLISFCETSSF